ncbi:hypothetical protein [Sagittula sp. S175]|uniref:hypothetical protein n=1 Tax=Sagittula sp. S175 TaxID=3415129 RepID=UPI003C7E02FF
MTDDIAKSAEAVALASLRTSENISKMLLDSVAQQQERQHRHMQETAEIVARLLTPQH